MIDYRNRAFIFDMDGTLVDNMRFHGAAWQTLLLENDIETDAKDFLIKTAGKTNREIIPHFFKNATEEKILKLELRKETLYRELFLPERQAITGVIDFLKAAKMLGVKMAIATSAPVENVEFILDGLDLRRFFNAITTAAGIDYGKPNPEIFLKSAEKLGVNSRNCLVFEDALNGFEAAHRARMKSVGIATVHPIADILKLALVVEAHNNFGKLNPRELIEKHLTENERQTANS